MEIFMPAFFLLNWTLHNFGRFKAKESQSHKNCSQKANSGNDDKTYETKNINLISNKIQCNRV